MGQSQQRKCRRTDLRSEAAALHTYVEALIRDVRPPIVSPALDVRILVLAAQLRAAGQSSSAICPTGFNGSACR
jgi:hypothetical protein